MAEIQSTLSISQKMLMFVVKLLTILHVITKNDISLKCWHKKLQQRLNPLTFTQTSYVKEKNHKFNENKKKKHVDVIGFFSPN